MSLPALVGHAPILGRLVDALGRDRLAHALLFTGPAGIGKRLTARLLAAHVFCAAGGSAPCGQCAGCAQVAAGTHPDLCIVERPPGKKEIGIELVRRLRRFAQMQAVAGRRKVAIVDEAEQLSVAAQNALLKTLEEPPGHALIVLVTATPGSLLSTVRSRCQRIPFSPLGDEEVAAVLRAQGGLGAEEAGALAAVAEGSPGNALLRRELLPADEQAALWQLLAELDHARYGSIVRMGAALGRTEQEMAARLELLLRWYCDAAAQAVGGPRRPAAGTGPALGLDGEAAVRRAEAVADALRTLRRRNPNRSLLAEALSLRLAGG